MPKFLPCDPALTDEQSMAQGRITPSQEYAITRILQDVGRSNGALLADDMGVGKTLSGVEVIIRGGFQRALVIALPDTHAQWVERFALQSDGAIQARVLSGTKRGRENLEAFLAGEAGVFIAGSHYLAAQDYESVPLYWNEYLGKEVMTRPKGYLPDLPKAQQATPLFKVDRKTGAVETKPRKEGEIGPAEIPIRKTKSKHIELFRRRLKRRPIDMLWFDEVQLIANKHAQARRTVMSIVGDAFRVAASGTWFLNNPDNMFSIGRFVWPGVDPETGRQYVESNHEVWRSLWLIQIPLLDANEEPVYRNGRQVMTIAGEREPGAFAASLPCYIRRESSIPIPEPEVIYVDPTPEQAAQMAELKADLLTWVMLWDGTEEPLIVDLPPQLHTRLRQIAIAEISLDEVGNVIMPPNAASAKLAPIRGLIENAWPGQPVAICTDSKIGAKFLEARMRAAGVDARAWHGDMTKRQRGELKDAFIAGKFRYLIATIQSFGTGIDGLQKVCDKVIWLSEAEGNPAANEQTVRRFLRPGRILRGRDEEGNPVSEFCHVRLIMRGSTDETSVQKLIHQAWNMRLSMAAPAA